MKKIAALSSQNYNALLQYNPAVPRTLDSLEQESRTLVLHVGRNEFGQAQNLGAALSERMPLALYNDQGKKINGVFTKKKIFEVMNKLCLHDGITQFLPPELAPKFRPEMCLPLTDRLEEILHPIDMNLAGAKIPEGARLDNRNAAMSTVADLLGMPRVVARSRPMKIVDETGREIEGTFMEFADGLDLHGKDGLKEFNKVADDPFAPPCKALPRIADLQAFDYLCGNVDRHGGNMSYKVDENGKFVDIAAFDNDTSFGTLPIDPKAGRFRQAGIQDLKVISKPMSRKLMSLTPEMLKFSLRGRGLTDPEIQASCDRLAELQQAIRNGIPAKTIDDITSAGPRLCVMETEDLEKIHINDIPDPSYALFHNVRVRLHNQMKKAREAGHHFEPGALAREGQDRKPQLTEVSTTERRLAAATGIAESMSDMDRMLENRVTGFRVSGLSRFLHSSGNWRDIIKAVKNASKAANDIRRAIGPEKEGLRRDDPKVRKELKKPELGVVAAGGVFFAVEAVLAPVPLLHQPQNIRAERVFLEENSRLMATVSWCCAVVAAVTVGACRWYPPLAFITVSMAFIFLIVRVVRNCFIAAIALKEENSLTI